MNSDKMNGSYAGMYCGMEVIINIHLTIDGEPYEEERSWGERLFTRPWRPFRKTNTVIPQIPDNNVYMYKKDKLFMHPTIYKLIQDKIEKERI